MGCSKNLVDSESLMRRFAEAGYEFHHNPEKLHGDIAVVNTCGFIGDAKEESVQQICDLVQMKEDGYLNQVIVMGCLSERYRKDLEAELPEIDRMYGKFDWTSMVEDLKAADASYGVETGNTTVEQDCTEDHTNTGNQASTGSRAALSAPLHTTGHYAYIKISEGCNRKCAYCAIPIITGPHKSRPMEDICSEISNLVAQGVHEFQIIAQELTFYGVDLYHEQKIAELVERISDIPGVEWIRLHYAYPAQFPTNLLHVIRERKNVCKYLDIALQHISDNMLSRMQRHITKQQTLDLIDQMRREVPGICLRTTLMVGFPGETEEDFEELLDFTRTVKFDRMGAFAYSEEDDTYAALHYEDNVPDEVKQERLDRLMALQQRISTELLEAKVGQTYRVIIDRCEGNWYVGRTEYDSPDVDCEVLIAATIDGISRPLTIGQFYTARITRTEEFDLYAEIVE